MTDSSMRKRLGQYFSGNKVANLLVNLCALTGGEFVIDPMAGVGDMLASAIQTGVPAENTNGIEIDPDAGNQCKARIAPGKVYIGDAFSTEPYLAMRRTAWDLVITNPPYVRYQSMGKFESGDIHLKSAKETRRSLSELVDRIDHLLENERACFQQIIRYYSGLSDLAVPAWLLCAALTQTGGRIAMVVPESWMSRDYAISIKYMLMKFFDIEYMVEDLNSVWFPNAMVKTNLLIAKRVQYRESVNDLRESVYKHIRLGAGLVGDNSLVEKLVVNGKKGYEALKSLLNSNVNVSGENFEIRHIQLSNLPSELSTSLPYKKLLKKLEPQLVRTTTTSIPKEIIDVLRKDVTSANLAEIGDWGFQVGQGLRTGANGFFYTRLEMSEGAADYLVTDKIFNECMISVDHRFTVPAFRYQSDACDQLVISKARLSHRLLYIYEDIYDADGHIKDDVDAQLAQHISIAENTPIEINGKHSLIPELSAVKPNVRNAETQDGLTRRHWFMLPVLTNRHTPQLCISRVNYKNSRCYLIADEGIVVDANFSTLWLVTGDKSQIYAMFALLNSTWTQSYLETIATVMGGGALKVEASQIRKLLFPFPTNKLITSLSLLGKRLSDEDNSERSKIMLDIDYTILKSLLSGCDIDEKIVALQAYLQSKINARKRK